MIKLSIITIALLLALPISESSGQSAYGPPKSEIGSKENPYYVRSDELTLKEYFESRYKALEDLICARLQAQDKAVELAKNSMEKRLDSMNEFRDTLKDQASRFVTRSELLAAVGFLAALMFGILQYTKKQKG
jgi:hypothetical protein